MLFPGIAILVQTDLFPFELCKPLGWQSLNNIHLLCASGANSVLLGQRPQIFHATLFGYRFEVHNTIRVISQEIDNDYQEIWSNSD
jgi:hypothetical protein